MRKNLTVLITSLSLCTALAFPAVSSAQNTQAQSQPKHHHYKLTDIGTLGGPQSYVNFPSNYAPVLNDQRTATGWADTSLSDPNPNFCFNQDCFISHAFQLRSNATTDLGTLPGGASSATMWISPNGLIAGMSQNGETDPLIPGFPEFRAVLWTNGQITDLGTLPEGGYESLANAVNSRGQVVGLATNTIADDFSLFGTTQARAFLWQGGRMQDLGTLGGTESVALLVNERGQIVGESYTGSSPSAYCANIGFPLTTGAFVWENSKMTNLGSFGGSCTFASDLNNRGQVIGLSTLPGDVAQHPFLWDHGVLADLGTLGGNNGFGDALNNAGDVVGWASLPGDQAIHGFVWKDGTMTDLGTVGGDACSLGYTINSTRQVVGVSVPNCDFSQARASLWEDGGPMVDLNSLILPDSTLHLTFSETINDRGEIAGNGMDSQGNQHAFLLIPCDENHPSIEGCDYSLVDETTAAAQDRPAEITQAPAAGLAKLSPAGMMTRFGSLSAGRNRRFGIPQTSQKNVLSGEATISAPSAALSPTSLTFSTEAIGTTSPAKTVTLKNTGTTSLTITAIAIAGTNAADFAQTHTCGSSLSAGASCSISLTFKPTASGTRTAAVRVTDNAAGSPQQVTLSGIGTTAKLSPTSLSFGTVAIGTTSPAKTVTLTNVGTTSLAISGIAITGTNAGDFAQTHTCGSSLAAGATCSISITFKPTVSGTRTAALSVSDNAAGSPQQVTLGGIGTTAKLFPTSLNFGTVAIGTTSPAKTVTLTNVGTTAMSITGIAITGTNAGDFAQTHTCGSSLAAGATCSINITFKPTASGTRTASLSVSDNAAGSPQAVSLMGNCPGGTCGQVGAQCGPSFLPPCCPGLVCVPASTRAFCEK